jgi:metal-sulfur cluster biosynthetic enzyme
MNEPVEKKTPLVWQAEKDFPESCDALRSGLREVTDPELGLDIIQLGLVRDLRIEDDQAFVKMILTTPYCPYGPAILEKTRVKAEEILKKPTHIDFGLEPWDFSMMEDGVSPDWGMF